jgi:hypothetical protein
MIAERIPDSLSARICAAADHIARPNDDVRFLDGDVIQDGVQAVRVAVHISNECNFHSKIPESETVLRPFQRRLRFLFHEITGEKR